MAVVIATVFNATDQHVADVTFTATKDTVATIPHTLVAVPVAVLLTPLLPEFFVGRASVTTIDSTNVVVTKLSTAASANAAPQVRVTIVRASSTGR